MSGIVHYEVYIFQRNNWDLLARYPAEQRAEAIQHAKDIERKDKTPTKVLRETYDLNTQVFRETLIYLSETSKPEKEPQHHFYSGVGIPTYSQPPAPKKKKTGGNFTMAVLALVFSIVFSVVSSAVLTGSVMHLIIKHGLITAESSSLFALVLFIGFFILLSVPLCYKLVDWNALTADETVDNKNRRRPVSSVRRSSASSLLSTTREQPDLYSKELYGTDSIFEEDSPSLLSKMVETVVDSFDLLMGRTPFSERLREDKERLRKELEFNPDYDDGAEDMIEEPVEEPVEEQNEEPEQTPAEEIVYEEAPEEDKEEQKQEENEERKDNAALPPELEGYYLKMTTLLSIFLRALRDKNILLNTYTRFGIELFLAGACEQMCRKNDLSKDQNQMILSGLLTLLGRSPASAETFFYKLEEYTLEAKYLPMIENGAESMRIYTLNPSSPKLISLFLSAMDRWLHPNQKESTSAGICTIMFTDMVSSTHMTQVLGDRMAQQLIRAHNSIVRNALKICGGTEVKHTGDGIMASFLWASNALDAAIAIQQSVTEHNRQSPTVPLKIRIGLNTGEPIVEDNDFFGQTVQLAARICGQADADQILVSSVVKELSAGKKYTFNPLGEFSLKGIDEPQALYEVDWHENVQAPQKKERATPKEKHSEETAFSSVLPEL